jgi:hypothetical protein
MQVNVSIAMHHQHVVSITPRSMIDEYADTN